MLLSSRGEGEFFGDERLIKGGSFLGEAVETRRTSAPIEVDVEMRPHSLAEVVAVARTGSRKEFGMVCNEFCDAFYLEYPDKKRMQAHIDPVPDAIGNPEKDAWIGAIGEHLALRWRLEIPDWTARPIHFALTSPVFMPPSKALSQLLIAESPLAFRSRLIFTMSEPLKRARFPVRG